MKFSEIVKQASILLQDKGQVSYRMLKREFGLDDEELEDLKAELIEIDGLAVDHDGKMLVWKGMAAAREPGTQNIDEASERKPVPYATDTWRDKPKDLRLDTAERRQLTVMFCDLVGSTALSEQLDPEELREVVQRYQATCTEVIRQYEGHIAQHLGDGLLVYFGYPAAHEDDAQRAVRTALGLVEAMQHLSFPTIPLPRPLQVRIGIHTGLVVIGEIGSSAKRETLALGETPNMAARLQGIAEPDTVVISGATQRLVPGLFACQDLGLQALKGLTTPVTVYRILGESGAQSRFEAAMQKGLTPLVGRDLEIALLRERWLQAKGGAGQVVLLSGDPGIGKSRLVQELKEQLEQERMIRIEFHCSPYYQNSAFHPIIDHLNRLLQFEREDSPSAKLEKLQATLTAYRFPQTDTVPLLAAFLSLPHPDGFAPLTLSPQKQKQKTQEALVAWIGEEAEKAAVYCAWEDLHWADPSTLDVLTLLLDQVPTIRLLAVLTFRSEFPPPWGHRSHLSQLTLSRLGRPQVEVIVERMTGGKGLPPEVVQQIVARTDGVPLFVEELTKMMVESELLTAVNNHYELSGPLPPLAIPATLQDSLMARLDRLGPAKEIAQVGATLGREFSYELLHAVSPLDEERLQQGLRQLVEAELVYQRGLAPQAHYLFKHALIQDTAYQALLKSTRQQYHQQIAKVLEEQFPEAKETQPELLAQHYTEAGLIAQAIPYWQQAGERTTQRSAYVEAIAHLNNGLAALKSLPDTPERAQSELTLQIALGTSLMATQGYAAPAVGKAYDRARELCQQVGETPQLFPVLWGLTVFYAVRGELPIARELGEQLLNLAQRVQAPIFLMEASLGVGVIYVLLGELTQAREYLERGVTLYDPLQHRSYVSLFGEDLGVTGLCWESYTLWSLGYPEQALKRIQEALTLARALSHPYSLAYAISCAARLHQFRREARATQAQVETLLALVAEPGFTLRVAQGTIFRGWALAMQEQGEEGIAELRRGLAAFRATGAEFFRPVFLALLAEAYGKAGQEEEGLTALAEALDAVRKTEERLYEAELYRLKGELTLQQLKVQGSTFNVEEAEECFQKAVTIARRQEAKSLELRATTSLARLWQQQGKQHEARDMLFTIYNWFTEGFDTTDLQETKALLTELEGSC